ncbi:MAG: hypothetical protein Q4G07_06510 [Oscillospiraceae bacterium]|nr:hypothetical protein [Oscillospiraceae bacterium]
MKAFITQSHWLGGRVKKAYGDEEKRCRKQRFEIAIGVQRQGVKTIE